VDAVSEAYSRGENDEFVKPTVVTDANGRPEAIIKDNDSVIFFNFRPDRARQLTWAFVNGDFEDFQREAKPQVHYVCMAQYEETLNLPIAYPPEELDNVLGEVLSKKGLIQLRIAETEKYAHVTFFLNGGVEKCYEGEDRCLIPSPKIATYDLKPEMSAYEVTDEVVKRIESGKYDVIILNLANMDMVGHTGFFEAAVAAVEAVDSCVGKIVEALTKRGGLALITADHGNAEQMENPKTGEPHTAHTSNPVKCIYVGDGEVKALKNGKLCDLAPTLLELLEIRKPEEMKGESLILKQ
jgi:2,3-bisphosphoglycerate-independent phosphoglycerate mutase